MNVWRKGLLSDVPMLDRERELRMTAANGTGAAGFHSASMSRAPAVANAVSPEGEEVVDGDGDDGIEEEDDGAQSGERKPRKSADPIMP